MIEIQPLQLHVSGSLLLLEGDESSLGSLMTPDLLLMGKGVWVHAHGGDLGSLVDLVLCQSWDNGQDWLEDALLLLNQGNAQVVLGHSGDVGIGVAAEGVVGAKSRVNISWVLSSSHGKESRQSGENLHLDMLEEFEYSNEKESSVNPTRESTASTSVSTKLMQDTSPC